jgi:RHS repeat-associated protein
LASRSISGGAETYAYGASGTMVKRTKTSDSSWTVYVGGVYEKNSDGSVVKYYSALGKTIAMRQVPPGGGAGTLLYPLTDHLGSTVGMLGSSGAVVSTQQYWPYGATRSATAALPTDKQYTGQQLEPGDSALALYNYKARFYSTTLGRFVSADSVMQERTIPPLSIGSRTCAITLSDTQTPPGTA